MKATGLILSTGVTVTHVSTLHDQISNTLSTSLGKWGFEYKLYRQNPASSGEEATEPTFLYALHFAHYPGETFCLTNGTGSVLQGDFDAMLNTKLQSLWLHRQTIKGEGNAYELNGGEIVLRVGNIFLQGTFKGLLIEAEYNSDDESLTLETIINKMNETLAQFNLSIPPTTKLGLTRLETAWKYVDTINR